MLWLGFTVFFNLVFVGLGILGYNSNVEISFFLYFSFLLISGIIMNIMLFLLRMVWVVLEQLRSQTGSLLSEVVKGINYIAANK